MELKAKKNIGIIVGSIVVVMISVAVYILVKSSKKMEVVVLDHIDTTQTQAGVTINATSSVATTERVNSHGSMMGSGGGMMAPTYKNGTYTAVGSYNSPGGLEKIKVSLTLQNDTVVEAITVGEASSPTSKEYQAQFISGFRPSVVGKNITAISLDVVSGSSLTSQGFNDAVLKIKTQAKG